jgi:hypothetical protein
VNTVVLPGQEVKYIEDVAAGIDQDGTIEGAGWGRQKCGGCGRVRAGGCGRAGAGAPAGAIEGAGGCRRIFGGCGCGCRQAHPWAGFARTRKKVIANPTKPV